MRYVLFHFNEAIMLFCSELKHPTATRISVSTYTVRKSKDYVYWKCQYEVLSIKKLFEGKYNIAKLG